VDLHAERYQVRQSAQRNTFTGKTYNSLENISQFFSERGVAFPAQKPGLAGAPRPGGGGPRPSRFRGARPCANPRAPA
jgi:DNA helicase-2/ATP-dependent DNA helicase PcrA